MLFNRANWDVTDRGAAHAREVAGIAPKAGWVNRGAKTAYWFAADAGVLSRVAAEQPTLTVALGRPQMGCSAGGTAAPDAPSFEFTVRSHLADDVESARG